MYSYSQNLWVTDFWPSSTRKESCTMWMGCVIKGKMKLYIMVPAHFPREPSQFPHSSLSLSLSTLLILLTNKATIVCFVSRYLWLRGRGEERSGGRRGAMFSIKAEQSKPHSCSQTNTHSSHTNKPTLRGTLRRCFLFRYDESCCLPLLFSAGFPLTPGYLSVPTGGTAAAVQVVTKASKNSRVFFLI